MLSVRAEKSLSHFIRFALVAAEPRAAQEQGRIENHRAVVREALDVPTVRFREGREGRMDSGHGDRADPDDGIGEKPDYHPRGVDDDDFVLSLSWRRGLSKQGLDVNNGENLSTDIHDAEEKGRGTRDQGDAFGRIDLANGSGGKGIGLLAEAELGHVKLKSRRLGGFWDIAPSDEIVSRETVEISIG